MALDLHVNKIILFPLCLQVFTGTTNSHLHICLPPPPLLSLPSFLLSVDPVPVPGAEQERKNDFDLTEEKSDNFLIIFSKQHTRPFHHC